MIQLHEMHAQCMAVFIPAVTDAHGAITHARGVCKGVKSRACSIFLLHCRDDDAKLTKKAQKAQV